MKKIFLLSFIAFFAAISGELLAKPNMNPNPAPDPNNQLANQDYKVTSVQIGPKKLCEFKLIEINLLNTSETDPIEVTLHMGANEPVNPNWFDFTNDGTEKLVVHCTPFFLVSSVFTSPKTYWFDCLENHKTLFADNNTISYPNPGHDRAGNILLTGLDGHIVLNPGYGSGVNGLMLPGIDQTNLEYTTETAFYEIFPIKLGDETLTFRIRDKQDNHTIKTVDVVIHVLPPFHPEDFVPAGSDDETND